MHTACGSLQTLKTDFLKITLSSLLLLLFLSIPARPDSAPPAESDSTRAAALYRQVKRDSLIRVADARRQEYNLPAANNDNPFAISGATLFGWDATSPTETIEPLPFFRPVRFGLANRLNRFLVYGNPAPLTPHYSTGPLLFSSFDATRGTDDLFPTEYSRITLTPGGACRYSLYPRDAMVPEECFSWENGLFNESMFDIRFMRPLTDRLIVNVFSNYRHFDNVRFTHQGNSVYSFYQSLSRDTGILVNQGVNPLTEEYSAGGRLEWRNRDGAILSLGTKYTDCTDEIALNRGPDPSGFLTLGNLHQFRSSADIGSMNNRLGRFSLDLEGSIENDALSRREPGAGSAPATLEFPAANKEISCAGRLGTHLTDTATISLDYRLKSIARTPFHVLETDSMEQSLDPLHRADISYSFEQAPAFTISLPGAIGPLSGALIAQGGYEMVRLDDSLGYAPTWSMSANAMINDREVRLYARQLALPYEIPFAEDSGLVGRPRLLDLCRVAGAELSLHHDRAGIVVGCQSVTGVERSTALHAWPEDILPYEQPRLSILAAPALGPWRGWSFASQTFFSDKKPYVKSWSSITFTGHPSDSREYITAALAFDYWSRRDPVQFAGISDWNREVSNLFAEVAVHIRSFRFFSKVDNLLDRKFAYVPGYYSPGLTFRWGISWFLQK